jgi:hypothetical protein
VTRRRWILQLGGAATLSGFSGMDAEAAEALPPGLYGPSLDHLAHSIKANLASGEMEPAKFLKTGEMETLRRTIAAMLDWDAAKSPVPAIASWIDLVLSEAAATRKAAQSLSPAHRALAVAYYGEAAVAEIENARPDETFHIARFEDSGFLDAGREQQLAKLTAWEAEGDASVLWLKRRVIEGFYTSKEGLAELDYKGNSFYPESPGCGHG